MLSALATLPDLARPLTDAADTVPAASGFSWSNLVILLVIAAVAWPVYRLTRDRLSRSRRERWAREEESGPRYTEANDPDLRRDDTRPSA